MNHLALYRQFRPVTFDEIIGQEHIIKTLKNQIKTGQISHAYLFCGSRGTGKTSAAKVFARAVNCIGSVEGNPCLTCKNCTMEQDVDIIELDAASNNGVDYIRDIKEKVSYTPINGKYKIYIIDEVHMLSASAFNAFLKTLEEPPAHAIFVLCTTEPQRLPQTILSRCLRFDFRLVSLKLLVEHLTNIFKKIKVKADKEAITAICQAGLGSVRDMLSIADRCINYQAGQSITYEYVNDILGATDTNVVIDLAQSILDKDINKVISKIEDVTFAGKSVNVLAGEITECFYNLLLIKSVENAKELLSLPTEITDRLEKIVQNATLKKLSYLLEIFSMSENDLRTASNAKILLEALCLKAALSSGEVDAEGIEMRLSRLERLLEEGAFVKTERKQEQSANDNSDTAFAQDNSRVNANIVQDNQAQNTNETQKEDSAKSVVKDYRSAKIVWGKTLTALREKDNLLILTACENIEDVFVSDNKLIINVKDGSFALLSKSDNAAVLQEAVSQFSSYTVKLNRLEQKDSFDQSLSQFKNLAGDAELTVDGKKIL